MDEAEIKFLKTQERVLEHKEHLETFNINI